jgi:hypothetical protein
MVASDLDSSAPNPSFPDNLIPDDNHTTQPPTQATPPANTQPLSLNRAHRALNDVWRQYFARRPAHDPPPAVQADNLPPEANVPWGPDAHKFDDDLFRVYFQNMHGFTRVNDSLPSWASAMDFLHSLHVSLFAFTEPNLQWDGTLLKAAKDSQQHFFTHGQLVTSDSNLQFPSSFKPGGTCTGINGKWSTRVTDRGVDPSGQGRWSYITLSGRNSLDIMFISAHRVCQKGGSKAGPLTYMPSNGPCQESQEIRIQIHAKISSMASFNSFRSSATIGRWRWASSSTPTNNSETKLKDSNDLLQHSTSLMLMETSSTTTQLQLPISAAINVLTAHFCARSCYHMSSTVDSALSKTDPLLTTAGDTSILN